MKRFSLSTSLILSCAALSISAAPASKPPAKTASSPITTASSTECCSAEQTSKAFTIVAKKAIPGVVFVKVQSNAGPEEMGGLGGDGSDPYQQNPFDYFGDDFFNRFFGYSPKGRNMPPPPQMSQGSGFIVTPDGYIMTKRARMRQRFADLGGLVLCVRGDAAQFHHRTH